MTLLVILSCVAALIFLATGAWALIQINAQLLAIGGDSVSFLATLRLGLRAIEQQTFHLGGLVGGLNENLTKLEDGLPSALNNLERLKGG